METGSPKPESRNPHNPTSSREKHIKMEASTTYIQQLSQEYQINKMPEITTETHEELLRQGEDLLGTLSIDNLKIMVKIMEIQNKLNTLKAIQDREHRLYARQLEKLKRREKRKLIKLNPEIENLTEKIKHL